MTRMTQIKKKKKKSASSASKKSEACVLPGQSLDADCADDTDSFYFSDADDADDADKKEKEKIRVICV